MNKEVYVGMVSNWMAASLVCSPFSVLDNRNSKH